MKTRRGAPPTGAIAIGAVAGLAVLALTGPLAQFRFFAAYVALAVTLIAAAAYLVWVIHPAWTFSVALVLSVFAGNWEHIGGIPGSAAPDRWLFVTGIVAVVLRAPPVRDRPPLRFGAAHWAMLLTILWFVGSALAAGTLDERAAVFAIAERVGAIPFLLFLVAPVVFATPSHRRIFAGALLILGAYLGFTALMETLELDRLVVPSYINDSSLGTHADRARGPFLEAVTMGAGLYIGAVGAVMALVQWRDDRWKLGATVVLLTCFAGLLFTETRSVWLAGGLATVVALLATPELRRYSSPAIAGGVVVVVVSIALVPGLAGAVDERASNDATIWDRKNLATAAVNMVDAYPLTGVGWARFTHESGDYFRVSRDFPLTGENEIIHNVFLTYAAETGLVGLALWLAALALGAIAALWPPGPGEARRWQIALLGYLLFYVVFSNFVFPQAFPNAVLWLLAGVAVGAARSPQAPATVVRPPG